MPEMLSGESSTSTTPDDIGEPVTWCDQCRGIQFDDANWGGHEVTNPNTGERYAQFKFGKHNNLFVYWELRDEFPNLPNLTSAMDKGCGFCAFLRAILRSSEFVAAVEHENESSGKTNRDGLDFELHGYYQFDQKEPGGRKYLKSLNFMVEGFNREQHWLSIECLLKKVSQGNDTPPPNVSSHIC